jgi:SAM-dependent methyltransferase
MNSANTAISRTKPSTPIQVLLPKLKGKVLDFGGGKGYDYLYLKQNNIDAYYWDPNYIFKKIKNECPFEENSFDTITCTYVLNTLAKNERNEVIKHIQRLLTKNGKAYISVRSTKEKVEGIPHEDGVLTKKKTFQKLFNKNELPNPSDHGRFLTFEVSKNDEVLW